MMEDSVECELKEIAESIQYGYTESSSQKPIGPKFLRITDIQNNAVDWGNVPYCKIDDDKLGKYTLSKGDLLFARTGATVGKSFLIRKEIPLSVFASYLIRVRSNDDILNVIYLSYFFYSPFYWEQITDGQVGIGQPNVNGTKLGKLQIPIPPLPIQRAIVAKIEALFSSLDSGIADLEKAQAQLKIYRQAVLKKAFEGELTKEWRAKQKDLPTADELLQEIKSDFKVLEKQKLKKKEGDLPDLESKDIPHPVPKSWVWCNLGDIAYFINGDRGKNYPNRNEYVSKGVPWINTGHILPNGNLSEEKMNYITREKFNSLRSGKVQLDDLVYCLRGATFGKTAFITPFSEGAIASSLMIIRGHQKLSKKLLYLFLTSAQGKNQLLRFDNGSAQPNLSAKMVRQYAFPFPPEVEQKQLVKEIETRLSVCDKVEESITQSLKQSKALRQSILKKAFEGKLLTPSEIAKCKKAKDYEPAAVLLERIKEEKLKIEKNKKNGKK